MIKGQTNSAGLPLEHRVERAIPNFENEYKQCSMHIMYLVNIEYRQIRVNRDKFPRYLCLQYPQVPSDRYNAVPRTAGDLSEYEVHCDKYFLHSPVLYNKHPIKLAPNSSSQLQFSFPLGLCLSAEFSAYQNSVALGHAVFDPGAISQSQ